MTTGKNNILNNRCPPCRSGATRGLRGGTEDVVFTSCSRCFLIDTQAIRRKILFLALRGKLTNQNPLEGSGHSLIEDNNSVLTAFSDDIKKRVGKGCKPIKPGDCLFEIPETWCWERFGNLVINFDSLRQPVTKSDRKKLIGRYDYYGATGAIDRVDDYIFDGDYLMIGEDGGNFFVSRDNSFIARGRFWANNHVHVLQPIICDIVYLKRCLDAYDLPKMGLVYGIGAPKLNQAKMNSIPIPVPPLAEQQRIVERIEQAFSALDTIDALQSQYADNLTVLKSKLIDAAIQGKLTEQLPEDCTAEELFRQIQAEKQALLKAGKIKKEKPLPEITADEIPFEIPTNWKWVRIGSIGVTITGGTPSKTIPAYYGGSYPFFKPSDLDAGRHITKASEYLTAEGKKVSRQLQRGSILVCCIGSIGKAAITDTDGTANQQITALTPLKSDSDYLLYAISSGAFQHQLEQGSRATTVSIINKSKFDNCILPLPPLAEQKRIVAKLGEVLEMIGQTPPGALREKS